MQVRRVVIVAILALAVVTLTGCFPGGAQYTAHRPAGFFSGIWHGWIAPLSVIFGLFNQNVRVYEPTNTGWWYDFGFYMAIISGFGSLALFRRGSKETESSET